MNNELSIKQNTGPSTVRAFCFLFITGFFSLILYLKSGWSAQMQAGIAVFFLLSFISLWMLYIDTKRKIIINKAIDQIQVHEMTLLGRQIRSSYTLSEFAYVRSIITPGRGALNCVELVTATENWGLVIASFSPKGGQRFFSLVTERENPKAEALSKAIADYALLPNKGFQGHAHCNMHIQIRNEQSYFEKHF